MIDFIDSFDFKIKPTMHLVAYMDILGGKNKIADNANYTNLNNIRWLYDEIAKQVYASKNYDTRYIDINIFSDNILISSKAYIETPKIVQRTVVSFFKIVQEIQYLALSKGFLFRGGIDYGSLYIDTNFVWGKTLISAYELEQTKAIFPRIILSQNAKDFLDRIDAKYKAISIFNMLPLKIDEDGYTFVNYLGMWQNTLDDMYRLETWTKFLKHELFNNSQDSKIMKKLNWIKHYHNTFCEQKEIQEYLIN